MKITFNNRKKTNLQQKATPKSITETISEEEGVAEEITMGEAIGGEAEETKTKTTENHGTVLPIKNQSRKKTMEESGFEGM